MQGYIILYYNRVHVIAVLISFICGVYIFSQELQRIQIEVCSLKLRRTRSPIVVYPIMVIVHSVDEISMFFLKLRN